MAIFKKVQSDNKHLQNLDSGRFVHVDGGTATVPLIPSTKAGCLLRVVLNTNGLGILLRSGSRVVGQIATDAPEQTFNYGAWCENGLTAEVTGTGSATILFDTVA